MLAGIKNILVITNPGELDQFKQLLGDGSNFGINLTYKVQDSPKGIAEALLIGEEFIANDKVALILGDNIFYGYNFSGTLEDALKFKDGAVIFSYHVSNPEQFGVVATENGNVISIEEKPMNPSSNEVVTGLYFYDSNAVDYAKDLKPSLRGELEISDLNNRYLQNDNIQCINLGRGFAWLDTGSPDSLLEASQFVHTIEKRQGLKVACLEEIALNNGWISKKEITIQLTKHKNSLYGDFLEQLLKKI
jgi:glucose-1-phosphate thymidylyltransferase